MITIDDLERLRGTNPAHVDLDIIAELIELQGVEARIGAGAQGRAARAYPEGYNRGCQGVCLHHTVSGGTKWDIPYLISGRGEGFVIADAFTPSSPAGGVDLIASGPTYTEGKGGPRGLIPPDGANRVVASNEIGSWGAERSIYPEDQQDAVMAWAVAMALYCSIVYNWHDSPTGPDRLFAHFEWAPGRKSDPRGISRWSPRGGLWIMNAFRSEAGLRLSSLVEKITPPPPAPPAPTPPKERIVYGNRTAVQVSSPSVGILATHRNGGSKVTGEVIFQAVDPHHEKTAGATEVTITVQTSGGTGKGWVSCNGTTVAAIDPNVVSVNTFTTPNDADGNVQLIVNGASCHLIVDRTHHWLPA